MSSNVRTALLTACKTFMQPVARYLLSNGIGFKEFSEIPKAAFVQVATEDYGIRGRRTNVSRTAVLTGLTRKEVKRVRDEILAGTDIDSPELGRQAQLLDVWNHDPDFIGEDGTPRELDMEGPGGFRELSRRAGGDVPPGAILTELKNSGAVEESPEGTYRCLKRHFNPAGIDPYTAIRYGEVMRDLATTLWFNSVHTDETARHYEYRVWNDHVPKDEVARFHSLVRQQGKELLEFLDDWLADRQVDTDDQNGEFYRCGLGLYFFESDGLSKSRSQQRKRLGRSN